MCSKLAESPALLAQPTSLFAAGGVGTDPFRPESVPSEEQRRSALNPNPGLRVHLHGVLGWLSSSIPTLAAVSQTVSSWRAEDLSHLFL